MFMRLSLAGGIPKNPTRRLYLLGILGINGEAPLRPLKPSLEYPRSPQEGSIFWGYWAFARRGGDKANLRLIGINSKRLEIEIKQSVIAVPDGRVVF